MPGLNEAMQALKVELARERLYDYVRRYGKDDPRVLAQSRRLDKMIAPVQAKQLVREGVLK